MNPLTLVGGAVLLFLAPGFLLLSALFPGRHYFGPFHPVALPALSVVASVAVVILVGAVLGFLPGGPGDDGRGWLQGSQSGAPVVEITLGVLCVALFGVAWWRGAFPLLGRRAEYEAFRERAEPEEITLLRDVRLEQERLRKEAARVRKRARDSRDPGVRSALSEAAEDLRQEGKELAERARREEQKAGERRYGEKSGGPRWRLGLRRSRGP